MTRALPLDHWSICKSASDVVDDAEHLYRTIVALPDEWVASGGAYQVHEILAQDGQIADTIVENGDGEYCRWVGDYDWVYRCRFEKPCGYDRCYLRFDGLDTVADIFLNGNHIARNMSMYLPCILDVGGALRDTNELHLYFHRHAKMLKHFEMGMPEGWKGKVPPSALLRKAHDYGAKNGFSPIGIFAPVTLQIVERTSLMRTDMNVTFDLARTVASVAFDMRGPAFAGAVEGELTVEEQDGSNPIRVRIAAEEDAAEWSCRGVLQVPDPKLWWPKNYGAHPLYRAIFRVYADGTLADEVVRVTGFREVRLIGSMKFEINGTKVRMWGADMSPIWGFSNRFNRDVALDLVDKADKCNINTMRIWGPSKPYPDELYSEFDRRGILIWQDLPTGGSQMPDSPEYRELYLAEAEHMVRRLKDHASIFMWCGGNENIYMQELNRAPTRIGFEMLTHGYRALCLSLDPKRYYHESSPAEGRYTNDPLYGDSHGSRALRSYCPGEQYGVFFSENIRVYPPQYKSFKRFIGEEIWEEGYVDTKPVGCEFPMPPGWRKRLGNHGQRKLGPIGDYYSASNAQELVYKFTAAAGQDISEMIARSRRGNPVHRSHEEQQCNGHLMWKFNDPWPSFYCAFVDYYGEASLPYYAAKRAFAPVMVTFEVADHVYVWGVNDTRRDVAGNLEVVLYDLEELNGVRDTFSLPVSLPAGGSRILTDLDRFGFFFWESVLYARLTDEEGKVLSTAYGYVAKENMLPFPDAEMSLTYDEGSLVVTTDKFAHCVQLNGNDNGNEFGWFFDDNYFDLMPFETKKVRIQGNHRTGFISARGQYSNRTTTITIGESAVPKGSHEE